MENPECRWSLDIEVYPKGDVGKFAQAKFLVHGVDDVYWADTPKDVSWIVLRQLEKALEKYDE